ncbi:MAG: DUF4249 family protein [Ignavibacteriae bacterium]|nr:DUF4249 family protein [Ignavibacteriota bacterium]
MIKKIILSILIFYSIFGCEEEVTFQAEYEEKAVLYCIINADSSNQFAMIKRNFSDKATIENNYIKNASIKLKYYDKFVEFKDTSSIENNIETDYYYANGFKPQLGSDLEINVELPNGDSLTSKIVVPKFTLFVFEKSILQIPSSQDPSRLYVGWTLRNAIDNLAFLTRLTINYKVFKDGIITDHIYPIPVEYVIKNNNKLPVYPQATRTSFQTFPQNVINTAFSEISKGDTSKGNYAISGATFEIFIMEENLAEYSASIESFKNSYSVKVYEPQITNIDGGLGVFGAYIKKSMNVNIDKDYVESFGYYYDVEE